MLKSTFEFNYNKQRSENFMNAIDRYGIREEDIDALEGCNDWVGNLKMPKIKKLVVALSELNDFLKISIADKEINYNNYDNLKKLFLIDLSEEWNSEIGMSTAINAMEEVDRLEEMFGKCVSKFTTEQMKEATLDLFSEKKYYKLRSQLNIISRFQIFYKEFFENDAKWKDIINQDDIKSIIGDEARKNILTKKNLLDLFKNTSNAQDAIIPILIFEGLTYSKVDEADELRYLKKEDLKNGRLIVRGSSDSQSNRREIKVDSDIEKAIIEAINQDAIVRRNNYETMITPLKDTEYIVRAGQVGRKKENHLHDENVISFRGVYNRIVACKTVIESMMYDIPFSPKSIETYGKIYYINRFMNEGFDIKEALEMTLKRFGDWYQDGDGSNDPRNKQLINRLKKVWEIYAK